MYEQKLSFINKPQMGKFPLYLAICELQMRKQTSSSKFMQIIKLTKPLVWEKKKSLLEKSQQLIPNDKWAKEREITN